MVRSPKRVWKVRAWPREHWLSGRPQTGQRGGRGVRLGLGGPLGGGAQEFLHVVGGLGFEVAQILIGRGQEAGEGRFQGDTGAGRQHGQGFRDRPGGSAGKGGASRGQNEKGRFDRLRHAHSLLAPPKN